MPRLSRRQTCAPHLLSKRPTSFLIHRLKPKIRTQSEMKARKLSLFSDHGGNPQCAVIPALLISVKTLFRGTSFFWLRLRTPTLTHMHAHSHRGLTSTSQHTRDGILSTVTHSYYLTPLSVVKHKLGCPRSPIMSVTVSSYFTLILFFFRQTQVSNK